MGVTVTDIVGMGVVVHSENMSGGSKSVLWETRTRY